jgi:hypothetical protein
LLINITNLQFLFCSLQNPYTQANEPTVMDEEDNAEEYQEEEEDDPRLNSGIEDNDDVNTDEEEEDDPRLHSGIEDNDDVNAEMEEEEEDNRNQYSGIEDNDDSTQILFGSVVTCMECPVETVPEVAGVSAK